MCAFGLSRAVTGIGDFIDRHTEGQQTGSDCVMPTRPCRHTRAQTEPSHSPPRSWSALSRAWRQQTRQPSNTNQTPTKNTNSPPMTTTKHEFTREDDSNDKRGELRTVSLCLVASAASALTSPTFLAGSPDQTFTSNALARITSHENSVLGTDEAERIKKLKPA